MSEMREHPKNNPPRHSGEGNEHTGSKAPKIKNKKEEGGVSERARSGGGFVAALLYSYRERHLARALIIAACLLVFLSILPPYVRIALLRGLLEHGYVSGMLLIFSGIALSLLWSTGQYLDAWIFQFFNFKGDRPAWLDRLMWGFTQLGSGLSGLAVALLFLWRGYQRLAYEFILGTLTLWLAVELVKALVQRSRPFAKLMQTRIVGAPPGGLSFPSGHTTQSFFTVTLLVQHFYLNFQLAALLYLLALFVGITRMYVGAHYPRDVAAGAMLGSIWGILGIIVDTHFLLGR